MSWATEYFERHSQVIETKVLPSAVKIKRLIKMEYEGDDTVICYLREDGRIVLSVCQASGSITAISLDPESAFQFGRILERVLDEAIPITGRAKP